MNRSIANTFAFALLLTLLTGTLSLAQEGRKVKTRFRPELPEIARQMKLQGTVRLEVEVASDGSVKATKALGGHPLLIQSAEQAIRRWKFEPGPASKTIVEFNFTRNEGSHDENRP